jgi:hypothetical protein
MASLILLCSSIAAIGQTADYAVNLNAGTLGLGVGLDFSLSKTMDLRIGVAGGNLHKDLSESDVDYHATWHLANAPVLLDWHPGSSAFRLTGGIIANANKYSLTAKPTSSGTFTFNNVTYNASEVGSATGDVKFQTVAPYLGAGFGRSTGGSAGWSFSMDFGVMYWGKPKSTLNVTCASGVPAARCSQLQSDVNAEADQLEHDIQNMRWYPVIQAYVARSF